MSMDGIKANELQKILSILDTDSMLVDTTSAGTGRLSFAQAAQYFKQALRVLDTLAPLSGDTAPTESTVGAIGQKYTDTTTGDVYTCIAVSAGEDGGLSYIWVPGSLGTLAEIRTKLHDLSAP